MVKKKDAQFDALVARLTDPATELPAPADVATGEAAAARGRALLVGDYGSEAALDAVLRNAGRPRLGEKPKGASPTVRGRIPETEKARFDRLMQETGKNESELVREAVHLLLEQHRIAS